MSHDNHFDVIIIGTGAGGGTLAYHLAPSGKRILILERGDYVAREKDNWSPKAVNVDAKYNTTELWRDSAGKELHPHTNYYVGGNTKFYGFAGKISENSAITAAFLQHGRSPTTNWSPTIRKPSTFTRCMETAARIRLNRQPARTIHGRQFRTSRAFSIWPTTSQLGD